LAPEPDPAAGSSLPADADILGVAGPSPTNGELDAPEDGAADDAPLGDAPLAEVPDADAPDDDPLQPLSPKVSVRARITPPTPAPRLTVVLCCTLYSQPPDHESICRQ
jgi:hypothetical protein